MPSVARRFPKRFKQGYESLFFDSTLSFAEKIAQWRTQPRVSLQLVASMLMLSLLAVEWRVWGDLLKIIDENRRQSCARRYIYSSI